MTIEAIQFHVKNFGVRDLKDIKTILIFTRSEKIEDILKLMESSGALFNCHYLIGEDGAVYETMEHDCCALEIDKSQQYTKENSLSITLQQSTEELENVNQLIHILTDLCFTYKIPLNSIYSLIPREKFPWYELLNAVGGNLMEKELILTTFEGENEGDE